MFTQRKDQPPVMQRRSLLGFAATAALASPAETAAALDGLLARHVGAHADGVNRVRCR